MTEQPIWQTVLRWLVVLPGAAAAAVLANVGWRLLNRLLMFLNGARADDLLMELWLEVGAGALVGAAFVYIGSRIAPSHRKLVVYTLALIAVLFSGVSAFLAIGLRDWGVAGGCIVTAAGAAFVAYAVATGELDLDIATLT